MSVFTAYLHSSRGDVSFSAKLNFIFLGISTVVFRVNNSGGVFRPYLVMQDSFLLSKLYVSLEISLELNEIYKLGDLNLTFV